VKNQVNIKWVLVVNVTPGAVARAARASQYFLVGGPVRIRRQAFPAGTIIDPTVGPPPGHFLQIFEGSTTLRAWNGPPPGILWGKGQHPGG